MGIKGKKQKESVGLAAPFLMKTYEMVEEEETNEVISWGEKGRSFVVWKPVEFARDLLPVNFKHNNFSSFVRQLNTYGFRKVVADRWEFANENFRREEQNLLSLIRRRKSGSLKQSLENPADAENPSTSSPPPLSAQNQKLRTENKFLSTELAQAKRHCDELLVFLSRYVDIAQLDLALLMNTSVDYELREEKVYGEKEVSLKLFGVLLKGNIENSDISKRSKRQRCEGVSMGGGFWSSPSSLQLN